MKIIPEDSKMNCIYVTLLFVINDMHLLNVTV